MSWPLSQDYNEAIQSPAANFADGDLKKGEAVANALGLPVPFSGNFADVYQVRCPDGSCWAVKCFTREVPGLRERYQKISAHLDQAKLRFMVDFSYLEQGIRVVGKWHPVLKMQWVEGLTLNQFVGKHLDKPAMLEPLAQIWTRMATRLRAAEVAHGDLQHGNILLVPGAGANSLALKLIDYDGMWTPSLAKNKSGEVGHGNYQHPQRLREGTYSLEVDRFPLLLVAMTLHALKVGGETLWRKYDNADNLLFKEADLLKPPKSPLFYELTKSNDPVVQRMLDHLLAALKGSLEATPFLEEVMQEARPAPVSPIVRPSRLAPTVAPPAPKTATVTARPFSFDEPVPGLNWTQENQPKTKSRGTPMRGRIAAAATVVLIALAGLWGAGVFKVGTAEGILVVQVNEPNADVFVDGERMTVSWNDGGTKAEIHVNPGTRKVEVKKDGFGADGKELTFNDGDRVIFSARLLPEPRVAGGGYPPTTKKPDTPPGAGAAKADKDFVPLFNGKDLEGWKTQAEREGDWQVENGVLIWSSRRGSFLWTERDDYTDFHLRIETRVSDREYAQLIVRDTFGQSGAVHRGYTIVLNSTNGNPSKTGALGVMGAGIVANVWKSLVPPDEWFTLEVIAEGNRVVVKVNGQTTADYTDSERRFARGHITLFPVNREQDPHYRLEFRKIEIKELK
jgi:hypothetical protein